MEHGFPHQPSALAFDPKLELMAIGTKSGAIKVYPLSAWAHVSTDKSFLGAVSHSSAGKHQFLFYFSVEIVQTVNWLWHMTRTCVSESSWLWVAGQELPKKSTDEEQKLFFSQRLCCSVFLYISSAVQPHFSCVFSIRLCFVHAEWRQSLWLQTVLFFLKAN